MDLTDIYRIVHVTAAECTFFCSVHGIFSKTGYLVGHKTCLSQVVIIKIPSTISNHNGMKLKIIEDIFKYVEMKQHACEQ